MNTPLSLRALLLASCAFLAAVIDTDAQTPANDGFAAAMVIDSLPFNSPSTTIDATAEAGEPDHVDEFGNVASNSVWWSFTPAASQMVRVAATGTTFDHVIAVYTGDALDSLEIVVGSDEFFDGDEEAIFEVVAGTTYWIVVDGYSEDGMNRESGAFTFVAELSVSPPNDDFFNAEELVGLPVRESGTNVGASTEIDEPDHANAVFGNAASASVWYAWQAPVTDTVAISVYGPQLDAVLAVYTGSGLPALVEAGVSDADEFGGRETVYLAAETGTVYYIAVDAFEDPISFPDEPAMPAEFVLTLTGAPTNDNFVGATDLGLALPASDTEGSTVGADFEPGEVNHGNVIEENFASASVWYRWQSPIEGTIRVAAAPFDGDVVLAVYTGTNLADLVEIGAADRGGSPGEERVYFQAETNTAYYIAVDAFNTAADAASSVHSEFALAIFESPPNDAFANAVNFDDSLPPISASGTTVNASSEFQYGEPEHANGAFGNLASNSVWYTWTASDVREVTLRVTNSNFDSVLGVYRGSGFDTFVSVAEVDAGGDGDDEFTSFITVTNEVYAIAVDGYSADGVDFSAGDFELIISSATPDGPYQDWIGGFPSLTGTDTEPGASPAGDGVPNLVKLALGLDPTIPAPADPNRGNLPKIVPFEGGAALQYTVVPGNLGAGAGAITHGGQVAAGLTGWQAQAAQNTEGDTWLIPLPPGREGQARLIVSAPNG